MQYCENFCSYNTRLVQSYRFNNNKKKLNNIVIILTSKYFASSDSFKT